jgi:hypothetical protein
MSESTIDRGPDKREVNRRPVVVCTDKRGVFFGYANETDGDRVQLRAARMCVRWSEETHGVLGLAATGPANGSRITKPVPCADVRGVTCVLDCTLEAARAWEADLWA